VSLKGSDAMAILIVHYRVKGKNFTIANLIGNSEKALEYEGGSLAIFRLAPQDYHRFHSPADVIVGDTHDIPG
jgi:phosphatidylserine decarboxylase